MQSMIVTPGSPRLVVVAPHAEAPLASAAGYFVGAPDVQRELAHRVALWHDGGTDEALAAAVTEAGATGLRPTLPRGVVDLNRGWKGRVEEKETLFGKGALDQWVKARLRPHAEEEIAAWYRGAMLTLRDATASAVGLVELHSYGDLGSTYDLQAGGRPVRRSESAVIHGAPWNTPFPVGIARLIPASLRGTPWEVEARVGAGLREIGLSLGPSPYPTLLPWNVSARFLAAQWFRWLGASGRLPVDTAAHLVDLAWTDEQAPAVDAAITSGQAPAELAGIVELATTITAWTHDGAELGDRFFADTGTFTVGVELRIDRVERAAAWGAAVARAAADAVG